MNKKELQQINTFCQFLLEWNKNISLISFSSAKKIFERHVFDSIQLLHFVKKTTFHVVDLGAGNGFPGILMAILRPDIKFTLIEKQFKKCCFLKYLIVKLNLLNTRILHADIKDVLVFDKIDLFVSRALASIELLVQYAEIVSRETILPINLLALKGKTMNKEINSFLCNSNKILHFKQYPAIIGDGYVCDVVLSNE